MRNYKPGICSRCHNPSLIVHKSKNLCLFCLKTIQFEKTVERRKQRVSRGELLDQRKLSAFYKDYWDTNKERYCVECGIELRTFNRWHIHHLIPKKKFKEYEGDIVFDSRNCVYVCLRCHSQAETDLQKTPKIEEFTKKAREIFQRKNGAGNGQVINNQ